MTTHPHTPDAAPAAPLTSNVTDVALVLEGGGMRASYTSGLVNVLLENGLYLDWVGGISAGSSLLSNYLSRDAWRNRHSFTDFVTDPRFGDWRTFARGRGIFHAEYIYEQAGRPGGSLPFDWATFAANPARLRIGSFDAASGESVHWGRDDVSTMDDLMRKVRASSTMPVLMPPVVIDGRTYVDGALGSGAGIPLDAAEDDGFSRFLVVLTQQRDYVKPEASGDWFFRRWFRRFPAVAEALATRPARYREMRERIFDLESDGRAYVFAPEAMTVGNGERSVPVLRDSHARGVAQAWRELPAIRDFLGV